MLRPVTVAYRDIHYSVCSSVEIKNCIWSVTIVAIAKSYHICLLSQTLSYAFDQPFVLI